MGALMLMIKMRPKSLAHAIIARETALLIIEMPLQPEVGRTPGVAHVIADGLSRCYQDNGDEMVFSHPALVSSVHTPVPVRTDNWYRALCGQEAATHRG